MNEISRIILLRCPVCGSEQMDVAKGNYYGDLSDAPADTLLKCMDCGHVLSRGELQDENKTYIEATFEDMVQGLIDDLENRFKA